MIQRLIHELVRPKSPVGETMRHLNLECFFKRAHPFAISVSNLVQRDQMESCNRQTYRPWVGGKSWGNSGHLIDWLDSGPTCKCVCQSDGKQCPSKPFTACFDQTEYPANRASRKRSSIGKWKDLGNMQCREKKKMAAGGPLIYCSPWETSICACLKKMDLNLYSATQCCGSCSIVSP